MKTFDPKKYMLVKRPEKIKKFNPEAFKKQYRKDLITAVKALRKMQDKHGWYGVQTAIIQWNKHFGLKSWWEGKDLTEKELK